MEASLLDLSYGTILGVAFFLIQRFLIARGDLSRKVVVLSFFAIFILAMLTMLFYVLVSDSFGLVFRVTVMTGMTIGIPVLVLVIAAVKERASDRNENLG